MAGTGCLLQSVRCVLASPHSLPLHLLHALMYTDQTTPAEPRDNSITQYRCDDRNTTDSDGSNSLLHRQTRMFGWTSPIYHWTTIFVCITLLFHSNFSSGWFYSEQIIRNTTTATIVMYACMVRGAMSTTACYTLRINVGSTAFRYSRISLRMRVQCLQNDFTLFPILRKDEVNIAFTALQDGVSDSCIWHGW